MPIARRLVAGLVLLAGVSAPAGAQQSLDEIDGAKGEAKSGESLQETTTRVAEVNGYAANRLVYSHINPDVTPGSTDDQAALSDLLELNVQLKVRMGSKAFVYGDVSLLLQGGGLYYTGDGAGGRQRLPEHFVSSLQPAVVTNELYAMVSPAPWLSILAGRKRIVWGSGMAFNPTDLINPPKDPTDPNFQRAGAWLARVELPFEKFTISALAAPAVLYSSYGLPSAILEYPSYALPDGAGGRLGTDTQSHYLLAARLYALIYDSDVNLFYFFSNKFRDEFSNKSRFGLSFSRYFFTDYELHVEALFQMGSARGQVNHYCVTPGGGPGTPNCPLKLGSDGKPDISVLYAPSKLDNGVFYPRVLVGGRRQFSDESLLSIEYYYQADGASDLEFEDTVRGLVTARGLGRSLIGGGSSTGGTPLRFTFEPLRRHYLIASYSKPKIHDDWTLSLVLLAGLRDLSGMISPTVSWNVREWLTLALYGFIPIRGIPVGQVEVGGKSYSEYSMLPFDFRAMFEARAYY